MKCSYIWSIVLFLLSESRKTATIGARLVRAAVRCRCSRLSASLEPEAKVGEVGRRKAGKTVNEMETELV